LDIPPKTAPRLFLIDAYALIYRAFFAFINRPLINSKGENTSAPFGFTRFLLDIRENYEPDYLAVVFDAGSSFREEEYPAYKATREKMPDDLEASLGRVRDIIAGFNDAVVELDGYEADDVIGTLARRAEEAGLEAVIVSGDKDFYQLVGPGVHLLNPGRGGANGVAAEWVQEENAPERFGIAPSQIVDYLALVGDSSDNVPGAQGIGPKTAVKLLQEFGSLDGMLARVDEVTPPRARKALTEGLDGVLLSKRLVTIRTDLPVDLDLEAFRVHPPDANRLREIFVELDFRRLAEMFASPAPAVQPDPEAGGAAVEYRVADTPAAVARVVAACRAAGRCVVAAEASQESPLAGELVGLSLAADGREVWYLPLGHRQPFTLTFEGEGQGEVRNLPSLAAPEMAGVADLLGDEAIPKVGHDLKRTWLALSLQGVELRGMEFDTMVASYVLDPGRRGHTQDLLALEFLARKATGYGDVVGTGRNRVPFSDVAVERARDLVCETVEIAMKLEGLFRPALREGGLEDLFRRLEMPLVSVLARIERAGISIDADFFTEMSGRLRRELDLIQEDVYKLAGGEFNLNSTPQLREVLFERLGLPVLKKTKTGASTDASVLEELAEQGHELPRLLMEYRELEKLRSTYVDALPQLVNPRTGRIHTSFNQTVAATGRLSSSDPNLQNIPIRTALGRETRKGFVAREGTVFLSVDYSQIELRVLAHFSGDPAFVDAFTRGVDVHRQTAAVIFDVPVDEVTPQMRGQAKTVNFATLYGQGAFSLARQLGITREEAKSFIDTYFERFAGVRRFLDDQVALAHEAGYVETLMGRRRFVPELRASNWNVRQFGERIAQNTPIQGTAADLMKRAMIDVQTALDEGGMDAAILLQVHDELLLEVAVEVVEAVREVVVSRMESAVELKVPLVADWGVGPNWYECKG